MPNPQCTAVRAEGRGLLTEESEVKARWAGYFEWLYQGDPQLLSWMSGGLQSLLLTLQSTVVHLCLWKQAVMNRLKWGQAPGICGIQAELLKAGGNAVLMSLHAVLCCARKTGITPTDWKRGLVVPLWKAKGNRQECNNYRGERSSQCLARSLLG